jgi:hypothetical protein
MPCYADIGITGDHAERLVMPSGRLMAFVAAAQERFWGSSCSA